jgi:hypothetical protein
MADARSDRLEAGHTLGFECLYRIGLELVVVGEALVETDDAFRLTSAERTDQLECELALQTDQEGTLGDAIDGLALEGERLDACPEWIATLEKDLIEPTNASASIRPFERQPGLGTGVMRKL